MGEKDDRDEEQKIFTLEEANELLPQLESLCQTVKEGRTVLLQTREEIKKASSNSHLGGGSMAGPRYIHALEGISQGLQTIHEFGVLVKDVDMGLCDFPYVLNGRMVYLCWKSGEETIQWWHEMNGGYTGRQALPPEAD